MSLGRFFFNKMVRKKDEKRESGHTWPTTVTQQNDIFYINDGNPYHKLDIYRPEDATGKLPVIIDVHGGGWVYGDKELNKNYCLNLATFGFAVVNVSYRLCPDVKYDDSFRDVIAALNFAYDHADEFNLDKNNFYLTGDSAGGHYISLVLATQKSPKLQDFFGTNCKIDFNAACFTCAAFNPSRLANIPGAGVVMFNEIFGKGYKKKGNELYFNADLENNMPDSLCPSYFITAYADFMRSQALETFEVFKQKGIVCEMTNYEKPLEDGNKLDHVFNVLHPDWKAGYDTNLAMCNFFKKYAK